MLGITALLLLAPQLAAAKMTTEALEARQRQAHDDAKLLRMKLPTDVSDEKVLDLTTKVVARGVPMEVLNWYLDHEKGRGRTGQVLVDDIETLATSMGGGEKMHGILRPSSESLIEMIKQDEAVPDASFDKPFKWSDEEYAEDLKLAEKQDMVTSLLQPGEQGPPTKQEAGIKSDTAMAKADEQVQLLQTTVNKEDGKTSEVSQKDYAGFGFWDVVFFALLGLVIFVAVWWAIKLRLHDRVLAALSDLLFRAKKALSSTLRGRDYDTQSDDISDTSLQTGTDPGTTVSDSTSSSGMGGVNTHLQGVIDRVRSSFATKDAGAGGADVERPSGSTAASEEEAPAKKGYTRQTKK